MTQKTLNEQVIIAMSRGVLLVARVANERLARDERRWTTTTLVMTQSRGVAGFPNRSVATRSPS